MFVFSLAIFTIFSALCSPAVAQTGGCEITQNHYSTADAILNLETATIIEFSALCGGKQVSQILHAELNGQFLPVSQSLDGSIYQVSWSNEHKSAVLGTLNINLYDDDAYSIMRKAHRSGEDTSEVQPMFTVNVYIRGASAGIFLSTEIVAALAFIGIWYFAYTQKAKLSN